MCTPVDESMQFLELLLGSAPISTENTNIIKDVFVDDNFSLLESTEQLSVQNERTAETSRNYKLEYLKTVRCLEEKNKECDRVRRCLEEKSKDHDQLKQQYIKLGKDYAELHYESKSNALEAIKANTNFEKITEELQITQRRIIAMENQYSVANTLHKAALSNSNQLSKYVEQLECEAANFKNMKQSYIVTIKEEKRNNSTLKYKIKTYEEDLCSLARKLDHVTDKKNRDRETQRQITKYTKKKFNNDLENMDSESVDTGRGSSFSNYSPAYSINFSPLNMTESFDQKMMNDASTSPLQTCVDSSKENIKTVDTASSPISFVDDKEKITTVGTASSPISFVDDKEKITTVDTASSPISFVDDNEKITTVDTASSPISFVDDKEKITTVDTASSPISLADHMGKTKLTDIALSSFSSIRSPEPKVEITDLDCGPNIMDIPISPSYPQPMSALESTANPIEFTPFMSADVTIPTFKLTDITRPLEVTGMTSPAQTSEIIRPSKASPLTSPVVQTPDITRPSEPPVKSPVVQTSETTRPFKPTVVTSLVVPIPDITRPSESSPVMSPVVQASEKTRPLKPAAVTSPMVPTPVRTRPMKPAVVRSPMVPAPEITKPFKPAAVTNPLSPVIQTPMITRPLQSADVLERSTDKTSEINCLLGPTVAPRLTDKAPGMTMELKPTETNYADLLAGPKDVKRQSPEMARPIKTTDFVIQEAKTTTSEHVISLANNHIPVISKTPDVCQLINASNMRQTVIQTMSRATKHADARRPLIKNKTLDETKQNENINIFSSEKSITEHVKEIQSHIAQYQERDDLEVRMILDKFRLDWNVLSPMSVTPDLDEEDLVLSKTDIRNNETKRQSSEHPRSEISKDSLLVITPDSKKLTIAKNKSNILKHKLNGDISSHLQNKVPKLHYIPPIRRNQLTESRESIKQEYLQREKQRDSIVSKYPGKRRSKRIISTIHLAQSKTNNLPQTQTKLQSCPIDNMPVSKEPQYNTRQSPEKRLLEKIESTVPESKPKKKSITQIQMKVQSSPLDEMSISKESKSNTSESPERRRSERIQTTIPAAQTKTKSITQNQMKLQSSPLDDMSILGDPESNTRIPPKRRRSERIQSTIPAAQSETKSTTQTQINQQLSHIDDMSISKEPQPNIRKPPEIRRSERIQSTIPSAQSKTKSIAHTQMKLQSNPIDDMSILEDPESNTRISPKRQRSERIKSTIPAPQSETKSTTQTQLNLQLSQIDKSISKEPQSNTCNPPERRRSERIQSTIPAAQSKTNNITQTQMKLQLSLIDDMSISKEPQSNTRRPPERRRSDRIKCTISTEESKTRSVLQTEMKLQCNPLGNMSISKEPQHTHTPSGCPPVIANPEYGRKRTICRSMEAKLPNKNSQHQDSKSDTSKCNSAEISSEDKFTYSYSKPPKERISRVKASVSSTMKSVPNNNQSESISAREATETNHQDLSYTPASEIVKLADDKTGFFNDLGQSINENNNNKNNNLETNLNSKPTSVTTEVGFDLMAVSELELSQNEHGRYCADYNDIDIFNSYNNNTVTHTFKINKIGTHEWTKNLLDKIIYQYGSNREYVQKESSKNKKIYEEQIAKEIENAVARCVNVSANPIKYYETLRKAVDELKSHSDIRKITGGLFKYLESQDRKKEFLPGNKNKNYNLKPTPTKYVIALLQIIDSIDKNGLKIWEPLLNTCRYLLFNLDRNANTSFDVVESVTHLFVNMCQYRGRKNGRNILLFMLAAMYCANYKAIIIIKICLELVPEILPRENDKTDYSMKPLLQTFMFLLYFYSCNDQFGKVQHLRFTLKNRYCYDPSKENETTILSMLKQSIIRINDHCFDFDVLEYSLLILAKRKNTMWCHKNIVLNILLPIIRGEIDVSKAAFQFCLRISARLLKPYKEEMSVQAIQVVTLLMKIIKQPHPQELIEDIISGLMGINIKMIIESVNTFLANWNPPYISPKFDRELKKYIERKPLRYWRHIQAIIREESTQ